MNSSFNRQVLRPLLVPVLASIVTAALIIVIGEALLNLFVPDQPELERLELWFGLGLAVAVIVVASLIATRPRDGRGVLEREVVIGDRPFFAPPPPPPDETIRTGPVGTVDDIQAGYTLYARNGELARVLGVIPGSNEFGKQFRAFLYAQGLHGASDELWIPVEAVMAVYPETRSVFLAIKGDETESFGWDRPPESIRRSSSGPNVIA